MDSVEQLREALFELSQQRDRDLAHLAQSRAVLSGLGKVTEATSPKAALDALLSSVLDSTESEAAALLECSKTHTAAIASTDPLLGDCQTVSAEFIRNRSRRIVDLSAVREQARAFSEGGRYLSMMSIPFAVSPDETLVLICLSTTLAKFNNAHQAIAEQLISLASQTLVTKRLADQNALLAAVLNNSSASFSIADASDPEARLIYVNKAFEELTGYSAAEALGKNCRFLSAEDPNAEIRENIRNTLSERSVGHFEVLNKRKSGEKFWNNLSIFPVEAGENSYTVATQWDLTSRVNAEAERDMARQQLVSALTSVKEGILLLDPDDRIVFINDRYRIFHRFGDAADLTGLPFIQVWADLKRQHGFSDSEAQIEAQTALLDMKQACTQHEATLPSGFQVLQSNVQTSVGGTVSVLSDVTALKVAQQQLSERVAAIDSIQDGIAITDVSGRFTYLNSSHIKMFGYTKESELLGRKWSFLYGPKQMNFIEDFAIPEMMATGQWRGEVIGDRKDGIPIAHEVTLTQLEGSGMICVTRDIADRIKTDTERTTLRDQLHTAQRQEAIGQMAAGLAHDFNNFLSVMSGSASLVLESKTVSERDQHAQRILGASEKAASLTRRLMEFGARKSERVACDIREPIRSAIDLVRSSVKSGIELHLDVPRAPIVCEVDSTDVLQVVINLIMNARDAVASGNGIISVGLEKTQGARLEGRAIIGETASDKEYAVVHVEDNGHGIKPEDIDTLFDAYVTTKADNDGTGLGLSVVRSLVQANEGAIALVSKPDKGTRFSVYWPMKPSGKAESTPDERTQEALDLTDLKAIVVDDDAQVAETIAKFLEHANCEVVVCDEPGDAVTVLQDDPTYWDVVVTDYDMPGMNGAELAQKLRNVVQNLPIVLVTALPSFMGGRREGAKLFDAHLSKPIDAKRLVAVIGRVIGK